MRISDWSSDVCSSDLEITAKNATPLTFTGGKTPVTAQYAKDYVAFSYRVTPKTAVKDSDVVFVGYGINAPEKGWNDYAGLDVKGKTVVVLVNDPDRSEEHTSEIQSLMRISYAVFCLKKKKQ